MKALLCREFGPEANMKVEEVEDPVLKPGHVLIDVKAGGLNFPDLLCVRGQYQFKPELPFVPGTEGAGVIAEVGEGVDGFTAGDRVLFNTPTGAFAGKAVIPAQSLTKIPDAMPHEAAAGLTIVYGTSYHALKQRAGLKPGQTLLVLGAAGGVGLATVELGKAMGATVIAAASTDEKLAVCKAHGADELINYSSEDLKARVKELTGGQGVDVIYDPVGGDFTEQAFRTIAWDGKHLVIGFAAGDIPKLPLNLPLLKGGHVVGVFWGAWAGRFPQEHRQNMSELFAMFEDGKIKPHVAGTYRLEDFLEAFNSLSGRKAIGKVVLTP
ncbi:NADPH:quinone oxidoreductase family protein [Maricaulis sp.]|uniref:NADPH:quinone oxidoreductase family protein n=1 Tax=Maricaulis sp. TaxID=1486257 RepID=UPI00262021DE|nr:NADPH:quinone oxidoreductase family protein [Maricaulis sp.]